MTTPSKGARPLGGGTGARQCDPIVSDRLALRPKEAARALGIGQRKLWALTQPRGPIPCVRVGVCVLYPVAALEAWLTKQGGEGRTG